LSSPITIKVADAANLANTPTDLTVAIEGRDKAKIFSYLGESKIKVVNGDIILGVKTSDMPTVAAPLQFTVVLTAPNYVTVRKDYNLTASYDLSNDNVMMVNLATPPAGVSVQTTSFATTAAGTAADVPLASPLTGGKVEQASFVVKAGTKPLAADGTVLTGAIETQLIHYDTRTDASVGSFANGFTNMTVKSGATTTQKTFTPAGFYSLSMTSGGKDVSTLSTPMDVVVDVDPDLYNEEKGRKIQVGDMLDIVSQNNGESAWNAEGQASVVSVGGKLKLAYKQPHLSVWVIGFSITRAGVNITINRADFKVLTDNPAKSATKEADCSVARETFNYKVFDANNPRTIVTQGASTLANNELLDPNNNALFFASPTSQVIMRVTDASDKLVYETPKQFVTNATFDLRGKLPTNKSVVVNASISASCGVNTVFTPAGYSLQYRDMAASVTSLLSMLLEKVVPKDLLQVVPTISLWRVFL
jgi:hypothetical protein